MHRISLRARSFGSNISLLLLIRDENTLDNEGMGRKSSKRCCIFHKQRAFDESSTDSSDIESDQSESSGASGDRKMPAKKKRGRKIAHPKQGKSEVPDSQRFHA